MARVSDWPTKLHQAIQARMNEPFVWGTNDCMTFSADMVEVITGVDHAADYRGTYTDKPGAMDIISQISPTGDNIGIIDTLFKRIPVKSAMRGDLVAAVVSTTGPAIGIVGGDGAYFVADNGLIRVPAMSCTTAWRVV